MKVPSQKTVKDFLYGNDEEKSKLFDAVIKQIDNEWDMIFEGAEDYIPASSGISGFIFTDDCKEFAKKNIESILYVLNQLEEEFGKPFPKKNREILEWYAWFALESVMSDIVSYKEDKNWE